MGVNPVPDGYYTATPYLIARDAARAIAAGAKEFKPAKDEFYGDRSGTITDPFGHVWTIATHKEDVSPQEMQRRFETIMKQGGDA